jgi:hypothetical protein
VEINVSLFHYSNAIAMAVSKVDSVPGALAARAGGTAARFAGQHPRRGGEQATRGGDTGSLEELCAEHRGWWLVMELNGGGEFIDGRRAIW